MMTKLEIVNPIAPEASRFGPTPELSEEDKSKDAFFVRLAELTDAMNAKHGKDFAMGTLVLSARFIAENRPLIKPSAAAVSASPQPHVHHHDGTCCKT